MLLARMLHSQFFFSFNDVAGTSPQRFLRRKWVLHLAPPCVGECSGDNPKAGSLSGGTAHVFNSDGQMTGPIPLWSRVL